MAVNILVPVRAFAEAKRRLDGHLDGNARRRLATLLATRTVEALSGHRVHIVCEDDDVERWARERDVEVRRVTGGNLNSAVSEAMAGLSDRSRIAVIHADLAEPAELSSVLGHSGNVLVPDARGDGTNVMVLEPGVRIRPAYGRGSFRAHLDLVGAEARRTGTVLRVVRHRALGLDIDTVDDLRHPSVIALLAEEGIHGIE